MLRFRYLASHKNNLIIDDFLVEGFWLALSVQVVGRQIPHIGLLCCGFVA